MSSEVQVTCGVLETMVESGDEGWKNVEGVIINADNAPQGIKEGRMYDSSSSMGQHKPWERWSATWPESSIVCYIRLS